MRDAGLRVPEDVSIIVTDELPLAAYTAPPLTTVKMPMRRMGEISAQMLIDTVHGKPAIDLFIGDEPRLVVRGSTAPPTT